MTPPINLYNYHMNPQLKLHSRETANPKPRAIVERVDIREILKRR